MTFGAYTLIGMAVRQAALSAVRVWLWLAVRIKTASGPLRR